MILAKKNFALQALVYPDSATNLLHAIFHVPKLLVLVLIIPAVGYG